MVLKSVKKDLFESLLATMGTLKLILRQYVNLGSIDIVLF